MSNGFSHVYDHLLTRAMEHEFATVPGTAAAKEDWETMLGLASQLAAKSHGAAALIMHDYNETKRPFVLFLRSFEVEAYDYVSPEGSSPGERKFATTLAGPNSVEEKVAAALRGRLAVLGLANPSQLNTTRGLIPRLQLPTEGWQEVVRNLVEYAHFIVIDCDSLAPGVMWELETIRAANRQGATVIVLPSSGDSDPGEGTLQQVAQILGGVTVVKRERPSKEMPEFSAFERVATEDEIPFDNLDGSPLFADLLASAAAQVAAAPPFNPENRATLLSNAGVGLFKEKRYAEALDLYQQALVLRRHINDQSGLLTSFLNIGSLYLDAGQPADALPFFTEGVSLARELNQPADVGLLESYIGLTHKQLGNIKEAGQWLVDAYRVQRDHGAPADVTNTLTKLSELFQASGDGDGVVACFKELLAFHQRRGNRAGELRATLQLGSNYYLAGLLPLATELFEEGVRLSREVGDQEREAVTLAMLERIKTIQAEGG
ncbi:MAG TPA: tetratricopeptide repeat protein [Chthoniobacterales bacterium]|nr:tetratricopeptide repeat protein [Chthoniobacterales bacterium]